MDAEDKFAPPPPPAPAPPYSAFSMSVSWKRFQSQTHFLFMTFHFPGRMHPDSSTTKIEGAAEVLLAGRPEVREA